MCSNNLKDWFETIETPMPPPELNASSERCVDMQSLDFNSQDLIPGTAVRAVYEDGDWLGPYPLLVGSR